MTHAPAAQGVLLGPRTTLGLGGPAAAWVEAQDEATLCEAVRRADAQGRPVFVLGGGSNVVVSDAGFAGLVVGVATRGQRWTRDGDTLHVEAAAGEPWDALVAAAVAHGAQGIECLSGIPGTVGATPIQNVGAYGQEVADTLTAVTVLHRRSGAVYEIPAADCGFGYRDSRFKADDRGVFVVLRVQFALRLGAPPAVRYGELSRALAGVPNPDLATVRDTVLGLRRAKGMVYDPTHPHGRTAGSFFTNPTVEADTADRVAALSPEGASMPRFAAPGGKVKLAAGWLIERAGISRGTRRGHVGVSPQHALALVNYDGTSAELVALAREIQARVWAHFGVHLCPEPVFVGFDADDPTRVTPGR